jgi:hypothetical protein
MKIRRFYVGFHAPGFRNHTGKIDPRCWLGHVEVWGFTDDDTWLFIDPAGAGMRLRVMHRHDEVMENLTARFNAASIVLAVPGHDPEFRWPLHGLLTCASVAGQMLGIRALLPGTLRRKLLRKGAEVVHEKQEARRTGDG